MRQEGRVELNIIMANSFWLRGVEGKYLNPLSSLVVTII